MAEGDITTPITVTAESIDSVTDALRRQGDVGKNASTMFESFSFVTNNVRAGLTSLNERLSLARTGLANLSNPGSAAASQFGLLSTSIIGATESFKTLNNVDSSGLTTFSRSVKRHNSNIKLSWIF